MSNQSCFTQLFSLHYKATKPTPKPQPSVLALIFVCHMNLCVTYPGPILQLVAFDDVRIERSVRSTRLSAAYETLMDFSNGK